MNETNLTDLPNIGATVARRLATLGIITHDQLLKVGPARVYRRLCEKAGHRLPVCYNLYSLEAALRGHDWRLLSDEQKQALRNAADTNIR